MVEEEDTELDELYDIVDLGDEIIRFFRNYSSVLVDDIIKKKLRKWDEFISTLEDDISACPSVSPNSHRPCTLLDIEKDHWRGHINDAVAWAVSDEDRERWNLNVAVYEIQTEKF